MLDVATTPARYCARLASFIRRRGMKPCSAFPRAKPRSAASPFHPHKFNKPHGLPTMSLRPLSSPGLLCGKGVFHPFGPHTAALLLPQWTFFPFHATGLIPVERFTRGPRVCNDPLAVLRRRAWRSISLERNPPGSRRFSHGSRISLVYRFSFFGVVFWCRSVLYVWLLGSRCSAGL